MVSQELLVKLKDIIQEDYGMELPMQEISEIGNNLVGFFETLAKIEYSNREGNDDTTN